MISIATTGVETMPTHDATRFRMPVGTCARTVANPAAVYTKGSSVFADAAAWIPAPTSARPTALDIPGTRSWSPPV
jgi:hypothetical protein